MRAWEQNEDFDVEKHVLDGPTRQRGTRGSVLTLDHVNKLKRMKGSRRAEHKAKQTLWQMMYGHDEVRERDLDRREADLEAREHELRLREIEAGIEKAIGDAEAVRFIGAAIVHWPDKPLSWPTVRDPGLSGVGFKIPRRCPTSAFCPPYSPNVH